MDALKDLMDSFRVARKRRPGQKDEGCIASARSGARGKQSGAVQGTATAAGLWTTGAIGIAVGLGSYDVAIVITAFTMFTFRGLSPLKHQKPLADDIGPPSDPSS